MDRPKPDEGEDDFVLRLPEELDFWKLCLDEDLDEFPVDEVDFFEAGPLDTPGFKPVWGFLPELVVEEELETCNEGEPPRWDVFNENLLFVFKLLDEYDDDKEAVEDEETLAADELVLLMVIFKPSWLVLTMYSLLPLLDFILLALSSLMPGWDIGTVTCGRGCLTLSGRSKPPCSDTDNVGDLDIVVAAVAGVDVIKLTWQMRVQLTMQPHSGRKNNRKRQKTNILHW